MIRFAHMSDCHLGSWSNHPDMRDYSAVAFEKAIKKCVDEKVDFIIIAGDLFDTSLPPIDILKKATGALKKCRDADVPVYAVPGSHDYSPTGKTMLSVLEEAGLLVDVCKLEILNGKVRLIETTDAKTGTKFAGLMGRKGGLDVNYYSSIEAPVRHGDGLRIFVFHAGIAEYRPESMKDMLAVSIGDLPKGFDYYATGHVHVRHFDNKNMIVFPGELFPTSFDELEKYNGSFAMVEYNNGKVSISWKENKLFDVVLMKIDVTTMTAAGVENMVLDRMEKENLSGKILLLKLSGLIEAGKISDIDFNKIVDQARRKGAIVVKRSTSGVSVKEFEEVKVTQNMSTDQIEKGLVEQHAEQLNLPGVSDIEDFVLNIMSVLKDEKMEDETNATFEERVKAAAKKIAGLQ